MSTPPTVTRHAACPGLFRLVEALDGGLCRVRLPGGRLESAQARAIAHVSRRDASGVIDITNRGNLQLRGVQAVAADRLVQALVDAGLGPTAETDATWLSQDERRNVMISPTAGIDVDAVWDTAPMAAELLQVLPSTARFEGLSPKFAVLVDGGEAVADVTHPHDIWLSAYRDDVGACRFVIGLAGAPLLPGHVLGAVSPADAVTAVVALVHAFVDLSVPGEQRMRDVLGRVDITAMIDRARAHGARIDAPTNADTPWCRKPITLDHRLGIHSQRDGRVYVGSQPVLGRLDPERLAQLADLSDTFGSGHLRMTPWQGCLIPDIDTAHASVVRASLDAMGLVTRPDAPLARIVACAGSTGCTRSAADTRTDAMRLASMRLPRSRLHLSGCVRSCASPAAADYTLMAVSPGRYDLFQRGMAQDRGHRIGASLTIQEAVDVLDTLDAE